LREVPRLVHRRPSGQRFAKRAIVVVLLAATTPAFIATPPAVATVPCWKEVINDEYDGHIDRSYPLLCYRDAIAHLQQDQLVYGSFKNDITRALDVAVARLRARGTKIADSTVIPAGERSPSRDHGLFALVANYLGPGNASSIPIPLLILACLAVLLVSGASTGYVVRRLRARRR